MKNRVVAIVVTYNRCELLLEAIEALRKSCEKCDIFIIDNASTDGTKDKLTLYIDQKTIFYFNTGRNLGGAGGFNFGVRKAYEAGYDYIWLNVLRELGITPFVIPFRDYGNERTPTRYERDLARWANRMWLFKSTSFENYAPRKGFKCGEYLK